MSDIFFFTDRRRCSGDFLARVETLAAARPAGIVLREKDLAEDEYLALGAQVLDICRKYGAACIFHNYPAAVENLGGDGLHLPLPILRELEPERRKAVSRLGASCHSVADAREAEQLGCTYITAGHIFDTACKAGLPGRGLDFLREVCAAVSIPVYAIGGIGPENIAAVRACGAAGGCVMGASMTCADPAALLRELEK